ncbi:UNVERIFIED_ORG: RNA recognition motif-containing protein [Comamonas terrigena]
MTTKLYVGNLSYSVRDRDLEQQFAEFGNVTSAKVMMERDTDRSKGFGFVEMSTEQEAQAAIQGLHEQSLNGRNMIVNVARPREETGGGYRSNNGGGGYRGGNNRY